MHRASQQSRAIVAERLMPMADETITGTEGDDTIVGDDDSEVIYGLGGNDSISAGNVTMDTLYGGDGNDTLVGGTNERDELNGDAGNDVLIMNSLGYAYGGTGDDLVQGGGGGYLWGDEGNDTVVAGESYGWVELSGGAGNDQLYSDRGTLSGGEGNDRLYGGEFAQSLDGGNGKDRVFAGAGDDRVYDEDGKADTLRGEDGVDLLVADWDTTLNWKFDPTKAQTVAGNTISGFESVWLFLGDGDDVVKVLGGSGGNHLEGGGGDDRLTSGGTGPLDQVLHGEEGNDTLVAAGGGRHDIEGGDGNDSIVGSDATDVIYGDGGVWTATGSDTVWAGGGNDVYYEDDRGDADTVDGGAGFDRFDAVWGADDAIIWHNDASLVHHIYNNTISGFEALNLTTGGGDDVVTNALTNGFDWINSVEGNDSLDGGDGNDTLLGGAGDDTVLGGAGNDLLTVDSGTNVVSGGAGNDDVYGNGIDTYVLDSLFGSDVVYGFKSGSGDEVLIAQTGLPVGNGDATVDGGTVTPGGGFASNSELVICTQSTGSSAITSAAAAAVIGDATSAYAAGDTAVFIVHSDKHSAVFYFESAGNDADVSAAELTLLANLKSAEATVLGDYAFGA